MHIASSSFGVVPVTDTIFLSYPILSPCLSTGLTTVLLIRSLNKSCLSTRAHFPLQQHAALWKAHTQPICGEETGWKATCSWSGWHAALNSWRGRRGGRGGGTWWKSPSLSCYIKIGQKKTRKRTSGAVKGNEGGWPDKDPEQGLTLFKCVKIEHARLGTDVNSALLPTLDSFSLLLFAHTSAVEM